jgi:allantoin racemase
MKNKLFYIGTTTEKLTPFVEPNTIIEGVLFDSILPHLEYEFYEHIATHKIIKQIVEAEKQGYDAAIIGCFYDPGLHEARELVGIPVIGVCEASMHLAAMISAGKFSVLVGRRKWIPKMSKNAKMYGLESRIASWRVLNLTVPMMRDKETTKDAIMREVKMAVSEDMAESIVLGCTGMLGQAMEVQKLLGVPILDPVLCGIKMAELRAILWKKYGVSQSKIGGYEPPPEDEYREIFKKFYGCKT